MKFTTRTWVLLLFAVIIIAGGVLYWIYDGRLEQRELALRERELAEMMIPAVQAQKVSAEEELAEIEAEYQELIEQLEGLNITLNLAEEDLLNSRAQLELVVESIEYGEDIFRLADGAGVEVNNVTFAAPSIQTIQGISYDVFRFDIDAIGTNDQILSLIEAIAAEQVFSTTIIEPVNVAIPPATEPHDIENIREKHRMALISENLSALTPEEIVNIIQDVSYEMFETLITDNAMDERIEFIESIISEQFGENLKDGLPELLAEDIAEFIEQLIADQLADKVAVYWGAKISELLIPEIEAILGGTIDIWMDEEVEGAMQGNITSLISGYISEEIELKISKLVEPETSEVEALVEAEIAQLEKQAALQERSTVNITLEIYSYQGSN